VATNTIFTMDIFPFLKQQLTVTITSFGITHLFLKAFVSSLKSSHSTKLIKQDYDKYHC